MRTFDNQKILPFNTQTTSYSSIYGSPSNIKRKNENPTCLNAQSRKQRNSYKRELGTSITQPILHDLNNIPLLSSSPVGIQPKLKINTPGDKYEKEADRLADHVMRINEEEAQNSSISDPVTKKNCSLYNKQAGGNFDKEKLYHANKLPGSTTRSSTDSSTRLIAIKNRGKQLPDPVRNYFEPRFGADFSNIRIHTDNMASQSARSFNALAYTIGNHIVFGKAQYNVHSIAGKRLLAHELTHTIQQNTASPWRNPNTEETSSVPLQHSISQTQTPFLQREVGKEQVGSSSEAFSRIETSIETATRKVNTVMVAILNVLPITVRTSMMPFEPIIRMHLTNLVRLAELSLEFNPGAGRDSPQNMFIYTCNCGWIDMGHFFFSATAAYMAALYNSQSIASQIITSSLGLSPAGISLAAGFGVEELQQFFRENEELLNETIAPRIASLFNLDVEDIRAAIQGNVRSAYTVEDLPSDAFGAIFGQTMWQQASSVGLLARRADPFNIILQINNFFSNCTAVRPTGETLDNMIDETIGPGRLPRQHRSTAPVLLNSADAICGF